MIRGLGAKCNLAFRKKYISDQPVGKWDTSEVISKEIEMRIGVKYLPMKYLILEADLKRS